MRRSLMSRLGREIRRQVVVVVICTVFALLLVAAVSILAEKDQGGDGDSRTLGAETSREPRAE
jgi:hypothetical protein